MKTIGKEPTVQNYPENIVAHFAIEKALTVSKSLCVSATLRLNYKARSSCKPQFKKDLHEKSGSDPEDTFAFFAVKHKPLPHQRRGDNGVMVKRQLPENQSIALRWGDAKIKWGDENTEGRRKAIRKSGNNLVHFAEEKHDGLPQTLRLRVSFPVNPIGSRKTFFFPPF